jgi:ribose transport system ATP-binding protein
MRDGKKIAWHGKNEVKSEQLICEMVGRSTDMFYKREKVEIDRENCTEFINFCSDKVKNVSFKIFKGEIVGLAGVVGAGRTELARLIFGVDRKDSGEVIKEGRPINIKSPRQSVKAGMSFLTEDRQRLGVILDHDVETNISIVNMDKSGGFFINYKKDRANIYNLIEKIRIKTPSIFQATKNLSGGNQQKVVLAKWLYANSDIIIFDEPTRGIDIGAKEEIYKLMVALAKEGKYILMISSDMPELISMSDRVLVMKEGRIVGEFEKSEVTEENILACSIGGSLCTK